MPKLTRHARLASHYLTARQIRRSDTFRDRDEHGIANAIHSAKPKLRKQTRIRGVVHLYLERDTFLDRLLDVVVRPFQIRRQNQPLRNRVDPPGKTETNPFE